MHVQSYSFSPSNPSAVTDSGTQVRSEYEPAFTVPAGPPLLRMSGGGKNTPSLGDCRWKDQGRSKKGRRIRKAELEKGRGYAAWKKMEILMIGKNQKDKEERNLTTLQTAIRVKQNTRCPYKGCLESDGGWSMHGKDTDKPSHLQRYM